MVCNLTHTHAHTHTHTHHQDMGGDVCVAMVTHSVASWVMLLKVYGLNVLMLLLLRSLCGHEAYGKHTHTDTQHTHTHTHNILHICMLGFFFVFFLNSLHKGTVFCSRLCELVRTPVTAASGLPAPWAQMSAYFPPDTCEERCIVNVVYIQTRACGGEKVAIYGT